MWLPPQETLLPFENHRLSCRAQQIQGNVRAESLASLPPTEEPSVPVCTSSCLSPPRPRCPRRSHLSSWWNQEPRHSRHKGQGHGHSSLCPVSPGRSVQRLTPLPGPARPLRPPSLAVSVRPTACPAHTWTVGLFS